MVSDPDTAHVKESLENLDFLIVQDIFLTETAELADLVLPASTFAEKDGVFTNTERRVQRVRKAIEPIGQSKPDWIILMEVMNRLGYNKTYNSPKEIFEEIASVTPSYGGLSYERIEEEGIQWPCPTQDHPGTRFLHKDKFARGKGQFQAIDYVPSVELPDEEYPLVLTTGRILYQYHTRTMTDKTEGLTNIAPESFIEMNPALAKELKVEDGEMVRVSSRRGEILTRAKVTDTISNNVVFIPFHYAEGAANVLTNAEALDAKAKIPEFKVCAVKVDKIS